MQNKIIQLHNTDPIQFKTEILDGVKKLLEEFISTHNPKDEFLTRDQVAEYLSISLPTLHSYVKRGIIKQHRIGSRVLYNKLDLLESITSIG